MVNHARLVWSAVLFLVFCVVYAVSAGAPTDQLHDGVDRVVKILRDPDLKGDGKSDERRISIGKVADEIFDFAETAKRALGQHWVPRTPAEREEFVRLFTGLIQRTYVSKVDQYNSEIRFRGDTIDGDQAITRTTLLLGKGAKMSLDYRMHRLGDRWLVYDLNIDGVSLVGNYRSQFNKIIRTDSYGALVAKLKSLQGEFSEPGAVASGAKSAR